MEMGTVGRLSSRGSRRRFSSPSTLAMVSLRWLHLEQVKGHMQCRVSYRISLKEGERNFTGSLLILQTIYTRFLVLYCAKKRPPSNRGWCHLDASGTFSRLCNKGCVSI